MATGPNMGGSVVPATFSRGPSAKSFGYHRIRDQHIAERIIASTGLAPPDLVFEFGAGDGQLTAALARRCRRVVAIEVDRTLWSGLKTRFAGTSNVEPVLADFLAYALPPRGDFKLVSNVPFGLTAELLRRLTALPHPPKEAFLVLQLEAAQRWAGIGHETLASVLLKTRFRAKPILALHRSAFAPRPSVDCVLLKLERLPRPLVAPTDSRRFEAFVRRGFNNYRTVRLNGLANRASRPTELTVEDWLQLFRKA